MEDNLAEIYNKGRVLQIKGMKDQSLAYFKQVCRIICEFILSDDKLPDSFEYLLLSLNSIAQILEEYHLSANSLEFYSKYNQIIEIISSIGEDSITECIDFASPNGIWLEQCVNELIEDLNAEYCPNNEIETYVEKVREIHSINQARENEDTTKTFKLISNSISEGRSKQISSFFNTNKYFIMLSFVAIVGIILSLLWTIPKRYDVSKFMNPKFEEPHGHKCGLSHHMSQNFHHHKTK